ncbi:MAG: TIM44-like domain-containing protein, partial [Ruminiclostridium sp.]|nr:TIM44-like domain-containing protein [Ruminiclostridium sp.]
MKKLLGTAAAAFAAVLLLGMSVFAFDANDYDYSYDYDDYDYDYGGGYSYSYDDDDDDYGGYSSGGGSGDGDWGTVIFGFLLIGGLLLWGSWDSKRNGKRKGNTPQNRPQPGNKSFQKSVPNRNAEIADAVRRFDPSFDSGAMTAFAQKTFVDVQNAWCARDLEPVRGVMHNNLYNTTKKQIQAKIDQHVTYHYENYTFRNAYLTSYVRDSEYEYITAYLNVEYIDYQTNDDTGEII